MVGRGTFRWLQVACLFFLNCLTLEGVALADTAPPLVTQGCQGAACDTPQVEQVRRRRVTSDDGDDLSEESGGSPVLGVLLGTLGGLGGMCGTQLALYFLTWIPVVGWVVALGSPFIVGTVGGLVAYAVVAKMTRRRTPVLPAVGAAVGSVCAGTLVNLLFGCAGYGCLGVGYAMLLYGGDSLGVVLGCCAFGVGGFLGLLGCLSGLGGYGMGGLLASLVGVFMGRPMVDGEQGLYWDMVEVPPGGDEVDEDRPRRKSKARRRSRDDDDDYDDDE